MQLVAEQIINGIQYGMLLFLIAAGLTLIFGIMHFINIAHGTLYMIGAYCAAFVSSIGGSFLFSIIIGLCAVLVIAAAVEVTVFRRLYEREHLYHVLATFGLVLIANDIVRWLTKGQAVYMPMPEVLARSVEIWPGFPYPAYRLAVTVVAIVVSLGLYVLISRTRMGMLVRAGASDQGMVRALGINIRLLYSLVFALGAALAALSGMLVAPLFAVEVGMGESVLILVFVIICIGGVGSVRGAFVAALLIGLIDTCGRAFITPSLYLFLPAREAATVGPAIASVSIYLVMAAILAWRPRGLFAR